MTDEESWISENAGYCRPLRAKISIETCAARRAEWRPSPNPCAGCAGLEEIVGRKVAECIDCGREREIIGRDRCDTCYRKFRMSDEFAPGVNQSERAQKAAQTRRENMEKKAKAEAAMATARAGFDAVADDYEPAALDSRVSATSAGMWPGVQIPSSTPLDSVEALLGEQVYRALCRLADEAYRTPVLQVKYLVREAALFAGVWEE